MRTVAGESGRRVRGGGARNSGLSWGGRGIETGAERGGRGVDSADSTD